LAGYYVVRQGECLASIAVRQGFPDYGRIYDHPNNADFRRSRPNPNIVDPGDTIFIPDLEARVYDRPTDVKHWFLRKTAPVQLRVVVLDENGHPRAGASYRLGHHRGEVTGVTEADGMIQCDIPPDLEQATLYLTFPGKTGHAITRVWLLKLGNLDPIETISGVQARLNNLGYLCGEVDGVSGPKTQSAVRQFQEAEGLAIDGIAGPETCARLKSVYSC
jgi:N-acetylmuramoyl-L-alanine amidase